MGADCNTVIPPCYVHGAERRFDSNIGLPLSVRLSSPSLVEGFLRNMPKPNQKRGACLVEIILSDKQYREGYKRGQSFVHLDAGWG